MDNARRKMHFYKLPGIGLGLMLKQNKPGTDTGAEAMIWDSMNEPPSRYLSRYPNASDFQVVEGLVPEFSNHKFKFWWKGSTVWFVGHVHVMRIWTLPYYTLAFETVSDQPSDGVQVF